jgi:hypothetical protein
MHYLRLTTLNMKGGSGMYSVAQCRAEMTYTAHECRAGSDVHWRQVEDWTLLRSTACNLDMGRQHLGFSILQNT